MKNISGRQWRCALSGEALAGIQAGVMKSRYRGRLCQKSPFDMVVYCQLIQTLLPQTIIEIGVKEGGSVLWFADMQSNHGIKGRVVSVDIKPPAEPLSDDRVDFRIGSALDLLACLPTDYLAHLPHPWLVVEDSAHAYETSSAVLQFFHRHLSIGDYIVIEDGIVQFLPDPKYLRYENGPNRAVADFLMHAHGAYQVADHLRDYFGYNVTYNPNGYLVRVA